MIGVNVKVAAKIVVSVVVCVAIALSLCVPHKLRAAEADRAVGGCGSGLCSGEHGSPCAYAGDGCGSYNQCQSASNGDFICTPTKYCSGAGCTAVQGGSCY